MEMAFGLVVFLLFAVTGKFMVTKRIKREIVNTWMKLS